MADCRYRFTVGASQNSDISVDYSTNGGVTWTPVSPGNYLTVNPGDTLSVVLNGPSGWSINGNVPVIITRANAAASGQQYSPFQNGYVFYDVAAGNGSWNGTMWTAQLSTVASNPGRGNRTKFEVTVAFNATLPGVNGNSYFSEDPELDVIGN